MKNILLPVIIIILLISCQPANNKEVSKKEIIESEKAFEKMVLEKGMAEAFYYFADENAAVRRGDSVIAGRENIHNYYLKNANPDASLEWTPDFVAVSDCGTMGYTYGKYVYTEKDSAGNNKQFHGIFHTVWKKSARGWRYVWD